MNDLTPQALATIDVGAAYRDLRGRVTELVTDLSPAELEQPVPHCPEWTIRETLAHLAGVVDDAINQNMEGVTTPAWTAAQVEKRAARSGPDIVEEWNTFAPFVDAVASERGMALSQLLFDAATHEHDLRHALGVPGARDSTAIAVASGFVVRWLAERPMTSAVRIFVDGTEITATGAEDGPVLRASAFDVIRSFGSRRSRAQVEALDWTSLDQQVLDACTAFGYPAVTIDE